MLPQAFLLDDISLGSQLVKISLRRITADNINMLIKNLTRDETNESTNSTKMQMYIDLVSSDNTASTSAKYEVINLMMASGSSALFKVWTEANWSFTIPWRKQHEQYIN